jgi:hypothetical protein
MTGFPFFVSKSPQQGYEFVIRKVFGLGKKPLDQLFFFTHITLLSYSHTACNYISVAMTRLLA